MNHRHPAATDRCTGSPASGAKLPAAAPQAPPGVLLGQAVDGHLALGENLRGFGRP